VTTKTSDELINTNNDVYNFLHLATSDNLFLAGVAICLIESEKLVDDA
jgi:proline dehydrogenase